MRPCSLQVSNSGAEGKPALTLSVTDKKKVFLA